MKIIGITNDRFGNHDNSAALIQDGRVVFAVSEERLSRKKHDRSFPALAIQACLDFSGLKPGQIDYFAVGTFPVASAKLIISYLRGFKFLGKYACLCWLLKEKLIKGGNLKIVERFLCLGREKTSPLSQMGIDRRKIIYVSHPLAHAVSALSGSGWQDCLAVDLEGYGIDGKGLPSAGKVFRCRQGAMEEVEEIPFYSSLALAYGAVTLSLGFKFNDGEGKTMGLAAFGDPDICRDKLQRLFPDFIDGRWRPTPFWMDVLSVSRREVFATTNFYKIVTGLVSEYGRENVAAAAQNILEETVLRYFQYLKNRYGTSSFALAGGLFLNVKLNMRLVVEKIVEDIFIYPNPGDGGVAAGAALDVSYRLGQSGLGKKMESAYLGPEFSSQEIRECLDKYGGQINYAQFTSEDLVKESAKRLNEGRVLGWFQGRAEWGPRALGNRSVIADPRLPGIKDRINNLLKKRDWFMPFAPSMLYEKARKYVKQLKESPFMILADEVAPEVADKIPAVVHIDGTLRPHFVKKEVNPLYYALIEEFEKLSGLAMVLNTSFNRHGLPMVNSPQDAVEHLIWGCVDELVIGNFIVARK